jgi:hypothetical protein
MSPEPPKWSGNHSEMLIKSNHVNKVKPVLQSNSHFIKLAAKRESLKTIGVPSQISINHDIVGSPTKCKLKSLEYERQQRRMFATVHHKEERDESSREHSITKCEQYWT